MKVHPHRKLLALALVAALSSSATASISFQDLGTAAPPTSVGGQNLTPFGPDNRAQSPLVNTVASPLGGNVGFAPDVSVRQVPGSWGTWSHGYTGNVYWTNGSTSLTLTLPADTTAFYFYVGPNPFAFHPVTVTAFDALNNAFQQAAVNVNGNGGASGFAFYTNTTTISSILISSDVDFAAGEFGIASNPGVIPEPSNVLALGLLLSSGVMLRNRRRKA